jgi:hypothetical protein
MIDHEFRIETVIKPYITPVFKKMIAEMDIDELQCFIDVIDNDINKVLKGKVLLKMLPEYQVKLVYCEKILESKKQCP